MIAKSSRKDGPSHKAVEAGVTLFIGLFGLIIVVGSVQAGINWGAEGPRAGFFPFYVGLFIIVASAVNLWNLLREEKDGLFAKWDELRQVLSVLIPTTIYAASIPFIGLYIASAVLIGWFMRTLGKYGWLLVLAVSIGTPVLTYIVFEKWFLVPLPKGPFEEWLGL